MSTVTLRTFEWIIPFGTPVQLRILDDNDNYIRSYNFDWPKVGSCLNLEIIDLWPCYDYRVGRFLMIRVRDTHSIA